MLKVLIAIERDRIHALDVITRQRTALFELLQRRRRDQRDVSANVSDPAAALATQLVTDALISRAEADLRWLDQCEIRINQAPTQAFDA